MMISQLAKSWDIEIYNEDNSSAFAKWRLKGMDTIQELVSNSKAKVALFKPILDTHLAQQLLDRFPNGQLIFIFRNFEDVVSSSIKKFGRDSWKRRVENWTQDDFHEFDRAPIPETTKELIRSNWSSSLNTESVICLYWLMYNRLYFDLGLSSEPRVRLLQYENTVSEPQRTFGSLCDFLRIRYLPAMSEGLFRTSVGKNGSLEINSKIRSECENLWYELSDQLEQASATL